MRDRITFFILILLFTLPSCSQYKLGNNRETFPLTSPWSYTDLRALDANDALKPNMDMLAAYVRDLGSEIQIRLDFLDLNELPDFDLYLAVDIHSGGSYNLPINTSADIEWDILILVPASGDIRSVKYTSESGEAPDPGASVRVMRDPVLDTITIASDQNTSTINGYAHSSRSDAAVETPFVFQVFITEADSPVVADKLGAVNSDGPPPRPVPVLFTFWNSYPAFTPALALRRWDGAHTGPHGGRHGLNNLLRTARSAGIPLLLLDLNNPLSLSALDYAGQLGTVNAMVDKGQLMLPEALPASNALSAIPSARLLTQFHQQNQSAALGFDISGGQFLFSPGGLSVVQNWAESGGGNGIRLIFVPSNSGEAFRSDKIPTSGDQTDIYRWREFKVVPVPGYGASTSAPEQATRRGPALETRQALINTAFANNQKPASSSTILVLGGELPGSSWGIPPIARATFRYINNRPWIKPLNAGDLLSSPPSSLPAAFKSTASAALSPASSYENDLLTRLVSDLESISPNNLTTAAWQSIMALYAPVYPYPESLPALRAGYLGQVGALLSAARWANEPVSQADCSSDPDYDGQPECVLASANLYTIIEIDNSALTHAFYLSPDGEVHQLIAPSSQFITGLSDPASWEPGDGLNADPAVLAGAFVGPNTPDQMQIDKTSLTFSWSDGAIERKTYSLLDEGIRIEVVNTEGSGPINTKIPLALDPWRRFHEGWADAYHLEEGREGLSWEIAPGVYVTVNSSALLTLLSFFDSQTTLFSPEDPNRDYPTGHFTPFPLVIVELSSEGNFYTQIDLSH